MILLVLSLTDVSWSNASCRKEENTAESGFLRVTPSKLAAV